MLQLQPFELTVQLTPFVLPLEDDPPPPWESEPHAAALTTTTAVARNETRRFTLPTEVFTLLLLGDIGVARPAVAACSARTEPGGPSLPPPLRPPGVHTFVRASVSMVISSAFMVGSFSRAKASRGVAIGTADGARGGGDGDAHDPHGREHPECSRCAARIPRGLRMDRGQATTDLRPGDDGSSRTGYFAFQPRSVAHARMLVSPGSSLSHLPTATEHALK